jgi:hypothetical protein
MIGQGRHSDRKRKGQNPSTIAPIEHALEIMSLATVQLIRERYHLSEFAAYNRKLGLNSTL